MSMNKSIRTLGIILLAFITLSQAQAYGARVGGGDTETYEAVITTLDNTLISVMKDAKRLGYKGRYKLLKSVIENTYDFTFITRFSVGRIWKTFDANQRAMLVQRFTVLSIATYAARFDGYSGEKFRLTSSKPLKRGRRLVRTEIVKSDGEIIHLDYVMRKKAGKWRAINVVANGVSDLSLKRAQYTYILKKKDFEGLIKKLDKKIAAYEKE